MMMTTVDEEDHHDDDHDYYNHNREFSSQRGVVGPTSTNHVIYDVALSAPTLHHPFYHTTTTTTHSYDINTAFKTPGLFSLLRTHTHIYVYIYIAKKTRPFGFVPFMRDSFV